MMMTINSTTAPAPAPTPPPIIAAGSVFASAGGPENEGEPIKHILAGSSLRMNNRLQHACYKCLPYHVDILRHKIQSMH